MSDHVLGEFPDLTPDHLRHTFAKPHNCPGLAKCIDHPKWSVLFADLGRWEAIAPGPEYDSRSRFFLATHAEAINHADRKARE